VPPGQRPPAPAGPAGRPGRHHRCHTDQGGCRLITRRAATQLPRRSGHPPVCDRDGLAAVPSVSPRAFWARGHATAARTSDPPSARVGLIAFVGTAVPFASVYCIPSTGLPWPIGVALTP